MWLIVGLGNTGEEYKKTRHNVGFMVVDYLHKSESNPNQFTSQFHGLISKITLNHHTTYLLKPQTFMNRSGSSVQAAQTFYKIPIQQIIVIHDDLDLAFGQIKIKKSGGHGGHNGLRDIIRLIGEQFIRIRLGIGKPAIKGVGADYVLSNYRKDEEPVLNKQIAKAGDAIKIILNKGIDAAQMEFNQKGPTL